MLLPKRLFSAAFLIIAALCSMGIGDSLVGGSLSETLRNFKSDTSLNVQALPFTVSQDLVEKDLVFTFTMNEGSYLYDHALEVKTSGAVAGSPVKEGTAVAHEDPQGISLVYFNTLTVKVPVIRAKALDTITLTYQGCSADGICYPPADTVYTIEHEVKNDAALKESSLTEAYPGADLLFSEDEDLEEGLSYTPIDAVVEQTLGAGFAAGLVMCFVLGMGLNLTPCVIPMLPVYSLMITGGDGSRKNALIRSVSYGLGLAAVFTVSGLVLSMIGAGAQAFFQHPAVTAAIALLLFFCALNCAGILGGNFLDILSAKLQSKLKLKKAQSCLDALILGMVSALIATPCTSAPLAGAVLFVMKDGNLLTGTLTFLSIGLGMAAPLIFIGALGKQVFLKTGPLSGLIRQCLAVPLFLAAVYLIRDYLEDLSFFASTVTAVTCIYIAFIVLKFKKPSLSLPKFAGAGTAAGIALTAVTCFTLNELDFINKDPIAVPFTTLTTVSQLDKYYGEEVLIDFTASWCVNCKVMAEEIFAQDEFRALCQEKYACVSFDLSDIRSDASKQLISFFNIIGIPHVVLLDKELKLNKKLTGLVDKTSFLSWLEG